MQVGKANIVYLGFILSKYSAIARVGRKVV
jgi:hypothetical protein